MCRKKWINYLNYLITKDARCSREIISRITVAKATGLQLPPPPFFSEICSHDDIKGFYIINA
jgi:hypothetical protein